MTTISCFVVMGRLVVDVSVVCCLGCVARMRFCRFSFAVTPVLLLHVCTVCLATLRSAQGADQHPAQGRCSASLGIYGALAP